MSISSRLKDHLVQVFNEGIPFNQYIGITAERIEYGTASMSVAFREDLVGDPDKYILHGGVVCSLIDTTGGLTAFSVLDYPRERTVNTVDMRVDFLRPARGRRFLATGKVIRKGKRICVTVVEVTNDDDVLVAHGTASYSILATDPDSTGEMAERPTGLIDGSD